jgi:hypothetical protein
MAVKSTSKNFFTYALKPLIILSATSTGKNPGSVFDNFVAATIESYVAAICSIVCKKSSSFSLFGNLGLFSLIHASKLCIKPLSAFFKIYGFFWIRS